MDARVCHIALRSSVAEIFPVDVGAESHVVGEVPAGMVGIIVDDDVVVVPEPVVGVDEFRLTD